MATVDGGGGGGGGDDDVDMVRSAKWLIFFFAFLCGGRAAGWRAPNILPAIFAKFFAPSLAPPSTSPPRHRFHIDIKQK
jgi:hypothetical protein